jgi:predicted dehydrogenase
MTIRVGLIGCGKIGQGHAEGYRQAPDLAQMVVCCDEWSEDQARETAAIFPGAAVATRWQDVIERDDIDAVDIYMPNWMHHEIALAAAAAGKHIFVEKPMGLTLAEAKDMATASE